IQEAREACGGAGYLAENRLIALRADTDVFTTFEGDNHVLLQLVAKELLTAYADDIKGMSPVEWVRFAANFAGDRVLKRTAAETIMQRILDSRQDSEEEGSLFNRGTQVKTFEAGVDACEDEEAREILGLVCDLYALSVIEENKAWFIEHRYLSTERAKAVTRAITTAASGYARTRRHSWTDSASPRSCATPKCCTRRTSP